MIPAATAPGPAVVPITTTLRLVSLAELEASPQNLAAPQAVIPRLAWRGRVTLLAGREKSGKSTLLAHGAAAVSAGLPFLGENTTPDHIVWFSADNEAAADLVRRFQRFDANPAAIWFPMPRPRTLTELFGFVEGMRPAAIVIDTLYSAVAASVRHPESAGDWQPVLDDVVASTRSLGCAVVLVHHASKGTGTYRDSTALGAAGDAILEVRESPSDPTVRTIRPVGRWEMQPFAVRLDPEHGYVLAAGDITLDAKLLAAVVESPGLTGRSLRQRCDARADDVLAALGRLRAAGAIVNRGTARKQAWYPVTGSRGSQPPGTTVVKVVPGIPIPEPLHTTTRTAGEAGTTLPDPAHAAAGAGDWAELRRRNPSEPAR